MSPPLRARASSISECPAPGGAARARLLGGRLGRRLDAQRARRAAVGVGEDQDRVPRRRRARVGGFPFPGAACTRPAGCRNRTSSSPGPSPKESARGRSTAMVMAAAGEAEAVVLYHTAKRLTGGHSIRQSGQALLAGARDCLRSIPFRASGKEGRGVRFPSRLETAAARSRESRWRLRHFQHHATSPGQAMHSRDLDPREGTSALGISSTDLLVAC